MCSATSTATEDLSVPSPQSQTKYSLRKRRTRSTVPVTYRGASYLSEMKARSLQRKTAAKRTLAASKSVNPHPKRVRSSDGAPDGADRVSGRRLSDVTGEQEREPRSVLQRSTSTRPGNQHLIPSVPEAINGSEATPQTTPTIRGEESDALDDNESTLRVTPDAILDMLKASEKRVLKHVVSQQRVLLSEISELRNLVKDIPDRIAGIKKEVNELKIMVLPQSVSNGSTSRRTSGRSDARSRYRNQTKDVLLRDEVVSANPTLLAELKIVCDTSIGSEAATKVIAQQIMKYHRSNDNLSITARCMNIFIYGFQRESKKTSYKDGIGFRHAEFRFKVALAMLELAKALPEQLFATQNADNEDENEGGGVVGNAKPSWLTSDLVNLSVMTNARKHQECLKSELPPDATTPAKKKALFIAKTFTKNVMDMLRYSRERCRVRMFDDDVFLLMDWEALKWFPSDLKNPEISLLWPEETVVPTDDIPETLVGELENVITTNTELLDSLISEHKEMLIEARYNVHLKRSVVVEGRKQDEIYATKPIRRIINILRVSMSFLCGFCHWSEQDIFKTHPGTLKCLYRFALVIRDMFVGRIAKQSDQSCSAPSRAGDTGQRNRGSMGGESGRGNGSQRGRGTQPDDAGDDDGGAQYIGNNNVTTPMAENDEENGARVVSQPRGAEWTTARKGTPPVTVKGLLPAESEVKRIITNAVEMYLETYKKLNVSESGVNDPTPDTGDDDNDDSMDEDDIDEDDMSDMLD